MSATDATILVVEDEDSFVDALTVGLRREGFRVQVARDGAEALDLFDSVRPDLVLLDVMLPKVSGVGRFAARAGSRSSW
jgi:two-component system, OmpR family, response regulator RegX3